MITIQVDNPEVESYLHETYGDNTQSMARAFAEFVHRKRVQNDITLSIQQLAEGKGVTLADAMSQLRQQYE